MIDCHLYEQSGRLILHLVNLTSEATWRAPLNELISVGPFTVKIRIAPTLTKPRARLLVSGRNSPVTVERGMGVIEVASILDHEVIVVE